MRTTLKDMLSSFIKSIDLVNYLLKNHHRHTAIIAWNIGRKMNLSKLEISNLVLSASLHDIGALSVKERDELVKMDIENPHPHSRLGSYMLNSFEPFKEISKIIFYHHWPYEKDKEYIYEMGPVSIESYIIHVADRIDILIDSEKPILEQRNFIKNKISSYSGNLFHPKVVDIFIKESFKDSFWLDIDNIELDDLLSKSIDEELDVEINLDLLEQLAFTFSKIIDCRSKFTVSHSFGVSAVSYEISKKVGYDEDKCRKIRIAGLLHDIGKIAVSNEIIEKKEPLTKEEKIHIMTHAYFSSVILNCENCFDDIANWASHHHETHLGNGYPDNLNKENITEEMDILAYADIFTALSENRPYRKSLPVDVISNTLENFRQLHGEKILDLIQNNINVINNICKEAIRDGENRYTIYENFIDKYKDLK